MPYCSQCGSQNSDNARFCSQCGTPLAPATEPDRRAGARRLHRRPSPSAPRRRPEADERDLAEPGRRRRGRRSSRAAAPCWSSSAGPGAGSRYLLDTDLSTVGRHPESDIFLDDITVSRRHVEFRREDESFRVHDVGSLNGTYLNGDRVDDAELQNGDEVRIGKFRLIFFASDAKGH